MSNENFPAIFGGVGEHLLPIPLASRAAGAIVAGVMSKSTHSRTRNPFVDVWNTRVTSETKRAFLAVARDHGLDRSEVAREAFAWFLACYEAAGKRLLSDIEKQSALASIKMAHSRVSEALAEYTAKPGRK